MAVSKKPKTINLHDIDINTHKIMSMEQEKRQRVINSAMEEFSKGYRKANTDTIVQNSGISKGLLFHYFGTKKDLFLFLIKYSLDILSGEFQKQSFESHDILENLWKLSLVSVDLTMRYRLIYSFVVPAFFTLKEDFPEQMPTDHQSPTEEILAKCFQNFDRSLFRDDVDIPKACNVILWTIKGFSDSLMAYGHNIEDYKPHYEKIEKELSEYMTLLRKTFYK